MLGLVSLDFPKLWSWQSKPQTFPAANLERLRRSGTTVFHPATGYFSGDVYASSLRDLTLWNQFLAADAERFLRVESPFDLARAKLQGKIGIVLGQQNCSHFRSAADVDFFYGLGQRVSQLTYHKNRLGCGSDDGIDTGLTPYGAEIVSRMNAVGMAIDVSHCGDRTTMDAIDASAAPVLITHSNCRALASHSRCKTDGAIRRMAERGGVFGVTMIRAFVGGQGSVTIERVLDHIEHVARVSGIEHVGLGSDVDLDGRGSRYDLDGMEYPKKIYELTEGMVRRCYSDSDIALVLGGNFARVLSEIWGDGA
jgi:membrane dipeptidase